MNILIWYLIYSTVIKTALIICAGLLIYFGYKLFQPVFSNTAQEIVEASFKDVKLLMKRVAPGIVFAGFGFGLLVTVILIGLPTLNIEGLNQDSIANIKIRGDYLNNYRSTLTTYNEQTSLAKEYLNRL